MGYRTRHFDLRELISPEIHEARGDRAWEVLNVDALITLDELRAHFGPITVNDWMWDGGFRYSGMRPFDCSVGARYSMHKYGGAFDCKPRDVTVQEMHEEICAYPMVFPKLRVLENIEATPTWLHFDVRNHTRSGIWIVNP